MNEVPAPALKEMFDAARYRKMARDVGAVFPGFDQRRFLELALPGLESLALLQRLRRATEALHATLPEDFAKALTILREVAPSFGEGFTALVLPDFVGLYGREDFARSLDALEFFTRFGSSEFAVREFLRLDLRRTLRVMEQWSRDENKHVRRLASEGCRPRLPWSFHLRELIADPSPVAPILENLRADSSLYVRKSVANHLNDITKDHPAWVLERIGGWDLANEHTAWIAKRALRTLIKKGESRCAGRDWGWCARRAFVEVVHALAVDRAARRGARAFREVRVHRKAGPAARRGLHDPLRAAFRRGFREGFQMEGMHARGPGKRSP